LGRFSLQACSLNEFLSVEARRLHLLELIFHRAPLQKTDSQNYASEYRDGPSGIGSSARSTICGALFLAIGAALLKLALKIVDAPDNPFIFQVIAWLIGFLAILSIGQGTLLVLTGEGIKGLLT
jgi:hypothetical protein